MATPSIPVPKIDFTKVRVINNAVDIHVTPMPIIAAAPAIAAPKIDFSKPPTTLTKDQIANLQDLVMSAVPCTPMVDPHQFVSLVPSAPAIAAPSISIPAATAPTVDASKLHVNDGTVDGHVTPAPAAAAATQKIDLGQLLHTSTSTNAEIAHFQDLVMSAVPCTPMVMEPHTFMML